MNNETDIELSNICPFVPSTDYFKNIKIEMLNIINNICGDLNDDYNKLLMNICESNNITLDETYKIVLQIFI